MIPCRSLKNLLADSIPLSTDILILEVESLVLHGDVVDDVLQLDDLIPEFGS